MRSITRTTLRSASCLGALVLAGSSWFGAGTAVADEAQPGTPGVSTSPAAENSQKKITVEMWWLLPEGADGNRGWEYVQTRFPVGGEIPCGRVVQADIYRGTQEQLDALGDTLDVGEDSQVYQSSEMLYGPECSTPEPTQPVETPKPCEDGKPNSGGGCETPAPEPSKPAETPVPQPSKPVETPAPEVSKPVETPAPEVSKPVETPAPETSKPVETPAPETSKPVETPAPETSKPVETPAPAPSDLPLPPTDDEGDDEVVVVPVPTPVDDETPVDLPLPPADDESPEEGDRPAGLPHTGDLGDGFSPYAAGAGVCGIAFLAAFAGRRKNGQR
ncbi:hypothetical protein ACTQ49_11190 [Luteococcus sp. Sow4_B9]|uniref:hypothetical protein n=1 Tax=Luteococcus sp. Sow4_B9 TaxID=3438792 RepID=UPI003F991859